MKLSRLACALFLCAGCGGESGPVADKPATQTHESPDSGFSLPEEPICGDGVVMGAEQCDDSGTAPLDGCNSFCEIEYGFICFSEPSECLTVCGDGLVAGEEQCDDSNKTPGDGCTSCLIDAGWQCVGGGGGSCTTCGDGVVLGTEECDDGNSVDFDGCTGCLLDCGNGLLDQGQEPEECDDGNSLPGDGCSDQCKPEPGYVCSDTPSVCETLCGDEIVAGNEKCDDGAMPDWDYFGVCCSNLSCEIHPLCECAGGSPSVCAPKCGNGVLDPGEECDDGNGYEYDNCHYSCKSNVCGDYVINNGVEQCDGGLGCNSQCQLSACFENPSYPLYNTHAKKSGDECGTPSDGLYCNGFGACVDHCMDNAQTEDEGGVDCGGSCQLCAVGSSCTTNNDCLWGLCVGGVCQAPPESCGNGADDDGDMAVDCADTECANAAVCGKLLINEVDYDQLQTDTAEFVELYNAGTSTIDLSTVHLVLVNGSNSTAYTDFALPGMLNPGAYLIITSGMVPNIDPAATVVPFPMPNMTGDLQNGAPDGIALFDAKENMLIDALSYEGALTAVMIGNQTVSLVSGNPVAATDSPVPLLPTASLVRFPNAQDTGDDAADWTGTTITTPGSANQKSAEVCDSTVDEDFDTFVDCADSDCTAAPNCVVPELCDNALDDDGDMMTDCADTVDCDMKACGAFGVTCLGGMCVCPSGLTMEASCTDMLDEDCDGDMDCADADCVMDPACVPVELCGNTVDDDGDMMIDCADMDCDAKACNAFGSMCTGGMCKCPSGMITESNCNDMIDDDCDGSVDCTDSDCNAMPCGPLGYSCKIGVCSP